MCGATPADAYSKLHQPEGYSNRGADLPTFEVFATSMPACLRHSSPHRLSILADKGHGLSRCLSVHSHDETRNTTVVLAKRDRLSTCRICARYRISTALPSTTAALRANRRTRHWLNQGRRCCNSPFSNHVSPMNLSHDDVSKLDNSVPRAPQH